MSSAPPPLSGPRLGRLALILAWLILLAGVGAAGGYLLTRTGPAGPPAVAVSLPPAADLEAEDRAGTSAPESEAARPEAPPDEAPEPETAAAPPAPEPTPTPEPATEPAPAATGQGEAPISEEGQQAALPRTPPIEAIPLWRRNSQPFAGAEGRPRIAIVLTNLGLSSAATEAAIKQLPPQVTLSFTPYSRRLNEWIALARVNGHEVMLDLPMEPTSYPDDDPGPQALLTALSAAQNLERLDWALERATGYVGVATVMGSRFQTSVSHLEPILEALKTRGLLFLDNRESEESVAGPLAAKIGLPSAVNDRFLDRAQASRVAIDARLIQLERIARAEGQAVAMARPYPVTIERLREWSQDLERRGLVLAPISAVVQDPGSAKAAAQGAG